MNIDHLRIFLPNGIVLWAKVEEEEHLAQALLDNKPWIALEMVGGSTLVLRHDWITGFIAWREETIRKSWEHEAAVRAFAREHRSDDDDEPWKRSM